ncbi:hypothetical protein LTR27_003341 [Elasticomyces elasticus]|nr:hypothetical protein LTR27_003341 [Elasticomyces elasticus]
MAPSPKTEHPLTELHAFESDREDSIRAAAMPRKVLLDEQQRRVVEHGQVMKTQAEAIGASAGDVKRESAGHEHHSLVQQRIKTEPDLEDAHRVEHQYASGRGKSNLRSSRGISHTEHIKVEQAEVEVKREALDIAHGSNVAHEDCDFTRKKAQGQDCCTRCELKRQRGNPRLACKQAGKTGQDIRRGGVQQGHPKSRPQRSSAHQRAPGLALSAAAASPGPLLDDDVDIGNLFDNKIPSPPSASPEPAGPANPPPRPQRRAVGRPPGGGMVHRRPQTQDVWWSVSQARWDIAGRSTLYRLDAVGRAQELGVPLVPACGRCVRRGFAADCKALAGGRCGRCHQDNVNVAAAGACPTRA